MQRSLIFFIALSLVGMAFRPFAPTAFNGVTGTWKRTAMTLIDASGKTSEPGYRMQKAMPCTKDITYTFSNDGRLKTNVPDACKALKKTIESMNAEARWVLRGSKLTVTTTLNDMPPATYDISFQGNTMTWVFTYADNPKTPNPTKAQRLTLVYERA